MASAPERESQSRDRSFWSGTITFGLVSIPVDFYPSVRSHRTPLKMLGPGGAPLQRRYFSEDGKALAEEYVIRGYERQDGGFVEITDKELEALAPRKSRDIDLRRFVPRDEIPLRLLNRPYVLAPAGDSTKAYHLLTETMERQGKAGIATFVMRETEYLAAIFAEGGLLHAVTLHFIDELRTPEDIGLPEIQPAQARLAKEAKKALDKLASRKLDIKLLGDEDAEAVSALAKKKRSQKRDVVEIELPESELEKEAAGVVDIMSILKRRVQAGGEAPKRRKAASSDDLAAKSRTELYAQAQELDIPGRSGMTKEQLIAALRAAMRAAA